MIAGGILAGGLGTRMGGRIPKQFLEIDSVPIIVRTIRRFFECSRIDMCYLAMNREWMDYCAEFLLRYDIDMDKIKMIEGGDTRFESLYNLASACENKDDLLISHDCARPFLTVEMLENSIDMCKTFDMTTVSVPTIDTVLYSSEDHMRSVDVPVRDRVFLDQGPQTFPAGRFLELADSLTPEERGNYMEAGKLFLHKGLSVGIVEGSRFNFKITTDYDLDFAEFLISKGKIV